MYISFLQLLLEPVEVEGKEQLPTVTAMLLRALVAVLVDFAEPLLMLSLVSG
jgi:hypothetical protein